MTLPRLRTRRARATFIGVLVTVALALAKPSLAQSWQVTDVDHLMYRIYSTTDCGSPGGSEAKRVYHQFLNTGGSEIRFSYRVGYTEHGEPKAEQSLLAEVLKPGESTSGLGICADAGSVTWSVSTWPESDSSGPPASGNQDDD